MCSRGDDNVASPDISIIIVSYNSEQYLERSLGSVAASGHELIVVDNASHDGSRDVVRRRSPSARLIELDENIGFGAASNVGMRAASGRYFLLLNPDAWPIGDSVTALARFADSRPRLGAAGPRLRSPDGREQQSAFNYPTPFWLGRPAVSSVPAQRGRAPKVPRGPIFVVGTALLLRREAVEAVGGFDERFFMFNEEIDLCQRLLSADWEVQLCREATFVHVGGASTVPVWPEMYRQQLRGHLLFVAKHRGLRQAELARCVLLASTRVRGRLGDGAAHSAVGWLSSVDVRRLLD